MHKSCQMGMLSTKVASSSPLVGRAYSLAELVRSICNTPIEVTRKEATSIANVTDYADFIFDSARQQFTIKSASIMDSFNDPVDDIRPPNFKYEKWCGDMEYLRLVCPHQVIKTISPFPSLKFLHATIYSSFGASPCVMRDELSRFLDTLPPCLEVLNVCFQWDVEVPEDERFIPPEIYDEIDALWAAIPTSRCPKLKVLSVDLGWVSKLFRTTKPLNRVIEACKHRKIPLILFRVSDPDYYCKRGKQEPKLEHSLEFESYIC